MSDMRKIKAKPQNYFKLKEQSQKFSSPLALGLLNSVPGAKDPIEAILWHAEMLFVESGLKRPPFSPANYAPLRRVNKIELKDMEVDGRLIPDVNGFVIELRKDRPHERKNFTCAHELGHTFFYESVPTIKYRTLGSSQPHHDDEEELLCNIAAAELLMPNSVFSKIAKDYSPSPQSLSEIAETFETSLTATVLNLLKRQIWNSTFILWNYKNEKLEAKWMARPALGLSYSPKLEIFNNAEKSSIFHCLMTGETITNSDEILRLNGIHKPCRVTSMQLTSNTVLSSFGGRSSSNPPQSDFSTQLLPFGDPCVCDGSGFYFVGKKDGTFIVRCRATQHIK